MDSQSSRVSSKCNVLSQIPIQAKLMRISYDTENAIQVMQEGLKPTRPYSFAQADTIVRALVL